MPGRREFKDARRAWKVAPLASASAALALLLLATPEMTVAQTAPPGFAQEFSGQFNASARKLVMLAEAMPESTYGWRPGEEVASVSEVFMHIARYNLLYPAENLGVAPPAGMAGYADWEKTVTRKADVVRLLSESMEHVRFVASTLDAAALEKETTLYGRKVAQWAVLLQLVSHMNEHLGQSIAYARVNGVVPPWSR